MKRYDYDLDIVPGNVPIMVPLKQYEDAYELVFHLYARTGGFSIPSGTTVSIRGTKPDRNGISIDASISGFDVTVNVIKQMTVVAGKGAYELVLTAPDGSELVTATFYLMVQRAAMDAETLPSDSVIKELADVLTNAEEIIAAAQRVDQAYEYINGIEERLETSVATAVQEASNAMNEASNAANEIDSLRQKDNELSLQMASKFDGAYVEEGSLYMTANGEIKEGPLGPFAGSGGGSGSGGNNAVLKVNNASGFLSKTVSETDECWIALEWSSLEDDLSTGDGVLSIIVNGNIASMQNVTQGSVNVDVAPYLNVGSNLVGMKVADVYNNSRTINFSIQMIQLSINSTFNAALAYTGAIPFPFTPVGNIQKTIHFLVDGKEVHSMVTSVSGRQQSWTIPAQSHGAHSLEVYFDCTINGQTVDSNHLYYELICITSGNNTRIVTSSFNTKEVRQYTTVYIPWSVYDPNSLTCEVSLQVNGIEVSKQTVDRTQQTWAYRVDYAQAYTFVIDAGRNITKTIELNVTESEIDVEATTDDLVLHLSSYGRSNNEEDPTIWEYGDIKATFTHFNWVSDGWLADDDGINVLRVSGDGRVTIPYQIFATDCRETGKTIEIEFATRNVMNYDAEVLSCWSGNRGIRLTTQMAEMRSELTRIFSQYKEDEHIRVSFVVQKKSEFRLVFIYINGVMSGAIQYFETGENFAQATPVGITIGSNDCTTDIYNIRVYDNNLNKEQILDNWIADTQLIGDMLARYQRNAIYDAYGNITIANLPSDLPYMVIEAASLPQSKGDEKVCSGRYVDPVNPSKSFTFKNAIFDVQGTSSQFYYRKNYTGEFVEGFINNSGATAETYAMNANALPVNLFCFKADVASSEGANNVELVRLYCDTCPVDLPTLLNQPKVRWGIDGFPIVVFWNDGNTTTFLGKYNFNNDKSTPEVFGFEPGDESWEIKNNTGDYVIWKDDDFSGTAWQSDFEGRYPDKNKDATRLQPLSSWIKSTDAEAATDEDLDEAVTYDGVEYTTDSADYRLAKFKNELANYFDVDVMCFNYLFTELFLMVDNRAKNAFPTFYDETELWYILPYDYDTALGINNEGSLEFGYSLEDIDLTEKGAFVYNGQNSVLYVNMRKCFYDRMEDMYSQLRADKKWSYDEVEGRFETHQNKWPEAIFNEDAQVKYLDPLMLDGDPGYLSMLQGSKLEQRRWWLYNRFRYLDSKYVCGDAVSSFNVITLRGYALGSGISLTPYADIYAAINWANSHLSYERAYRNEEVYFENPLDAVNDSEIYIYSASSIASVGDLSPMKVGYANFSYATRLQRIKVGDPAETYVNENFNELYLGNNVLLQYLDARNCPNLGTGEQQAIDASGCINLEEVYFTGTSIKGISLANGGAVRILHLPETIANLTLRNLNRLETLRIDGYENITTLNLEGVNDKVDIRGIINNLVITEEQKPRLRIVGFRMEFDSADDVSDFYDQLDTFAGVDEHDKNLDKPQISGTIFVSSLKGSDIAELQERYPYVDFEYDTLTSYLYYYNGDTLFHTEEIVNGGNGIYTGQPTKASDAQFTYSFVGWSWEDGSEVLDEDARLNVVADRKIYAAYARTIRTYTITFANVSGKVLGYVYNVPYGSTAVYTGEDPVYDGPDDPADYTFNGTWEPSNIGITGALTCVAQYKYSGYIMRKILSDNMAYQLSNDKVTQMCDYALVSAENLTKIDLPKLENMGIYGLYYPIRTVEVNMPLLTEIPKCGLTMVGRYSDSYAVLNLGQLTEIGDEGIGDGNIGKLPDLSKITKLGEDVFNYILFENAEVLNDFKFPSLIEMADSAIYRWRSSSQFPEVVSEDMFPVLTTASWRLLASLEYVKSITLPSLTSMAEYAFSGDYRLEYVDLPKLSGGIAGYSFNDCRSLKTVILRSETIVTLKSTSTFSNCYHLTGTVNTSYNPNGDKDCYFYVPASLVESYQAATNWSTYADRFRALEDYTVDGTIAGALDDTKVNGGEA